MNDERGIGLGGGGDDTAISLSVAFNLLANGHRRHLLSYLADRNRPVPFSELAGAVIERSTGTGDGATRTDFLGEEYRRITLAIEREHLPLLERHDVVIYDRERRLIELAEDVSPLDRLLAMTRRRSDE